jgi:ATP-dependent Clp protease ATP-binding subunit ClpC
MFDKYNQNARRALFFSRYEASARNELLIDTHHLLLGVLRENDEATRELFASVGVDPMQFHELWPSLTDRVSSSAELPLSENAKKALAYTAHEAEQTAAVEVAPIHILLGILRTQGSPGATALAQAGMTYGSVVETSHAIVAKVAQRRAVEEQTPIVLRSSHYVLVDKIRGQVSSNRRRPTSREEVVLALLDGLVANPQLFPTVASLDELRVRMAEAIAGLPPGA